VSDDRGFGALVQRIAHGRRQAVIAGIIGVLIGASVAFAASRAGDSTPASSPDRARIEQIVHDYILAHPEILPQAMDALRDRETAKVVDANRKDIETPFGSAWAGARGGGVTLVEFFDYACSYCRASNPDVERLLRENKDLKMVWRELPVLGEDSVAAAHASLAAARQGRFRTFHDRLFAAGLPSAQAVQAVQQAAGVTPVQSAEFSAEIEKNLQLAQQLGASGTPTWVVGDKVLHGAVGYDALQDAIEAARKKG
jgi:protein-disulfide isomerase